MTDERRNIKIQDEEFQPLKELKPEGVSWGMFLVTLAEVYKELYGDQFPPVGRPENPRD